MDHYKKIILGSRGSRLAMIQADIIVQKLSAAGYSNAEIKTVITSGDKDTDTSIIDLGGKGVFVKEIERRLLDGEIDIAVHSLKDMPSKGPDGLTIGAYIKASDTRDVLVSRDKLGLYQLSKSASIGTGSPRRRIQLLNIRNDLKIEPIRGNVETRINKVLNGDYDAAILAFAGIKRLGLESFISEYFDYEQMLPSPGQGVIAVQARESDKDMLNILKSIDDAEQRIISEIEFALMHELGATCHTPIAMQSGFSGKHYWLDFFLSTENGDKQMRRKFSHQFSDKNNSVKILLNDINIHWHN